MPEPVVVFEVVSPSSGRLDRFVKVREYRAVRSIRRYVILESMGIAATVLSRAGADEGWALATLLPGDDLPLPELGIFVPLGEVYRGTGLPETVLDEAYGA